MKENRFIELLNLYIDRQITATETAELEAELQSNPKRQAVYRQYCQIHTATKQVYASFRASSSVSLDPSKSGRPAESTNSESPVITPHGDSGCLDSASRKPMCSGVWPGVCLP